MCSAHTRILNARHGRAPANNAARSSTSSASASTPSSDCNHAKQCSKCTKSARFQPVSSHLKINTRRAYRVSPLLRSKNQQGPTAINKNSRSGMIPPSPPTFRRRNLSEKRLAWDFVPGATRTAAGSSNPILSANFLTHLKSERRSAFARPPRCIQASW